MGFHNKNNPAKESSSSTTQPRQNNRPLAAMLIVLSVACIIGGLVYITSLPILSVALFAAAIAIALGTRKTWKKTESIPTMPHAKPSDAPREIAGAPKKLRDDILLPPQYQTSISATAPSQPEPESASAVEVPAIVETAAPDTVSLDPESAPIEQELPAPAPAVPESIRQLPDFVPIDRDLPKLPTIRGSDMTDSDTLYVVPKTYKVVDTQSCIDNILRLASRNPDYDLTTEAQTERVAENKRIYAYTFNPKKAELVSEPHNPHNPDAIKVMIDGEHVGYIHTDFCTHLLNALSGNRVRGIDCEMSGGPYKILRGDLDEETFEYIYRMDEVDAEFLIHLYVLEEK